MPDPTAHSRPPIVTISRANAEHYLWGQQCQGWHLVKGPELSVIEEVMPPNTAEQLHRHHIAQQFFYILSGEAVMEVASEIFTLSAGEGIAIAAGLAHRIRNASPGDIRFLVISQPSVKYGDRENLD